MKRGATKEDIIRATRELISRNGIRAVRVDEIAQTAGISKRTLYELFDDKTELVTACLSDMNRRMRQRIAAYQRKTTPALNTLFKLAYDYTDSLYLVDSSFLADLRHKIAFNEQYAEHHNFWLAELSKIFEQGRHEELLLPGTDAPVFAERLMGTLFDLRQTSISREELRLFCRTVIRGTATYKGIEYIDRKC